MRSSCVLLFGIALLACSDKDVGQATATATAKQAQDQAALVAQAAPSEEQQATIRRIVVSWLECEECDQGQLKAVVDLGKLVVPTLAAALREGPSPASRERLKLGLERTYRDMSKYSHLQYSEESYVATFLTNYEALYKIRAARALSAIGGDEAKKALEIANSAHAPPNVKKEIEAALTSIQVP